MQYEGGEILHTGFVFLKDSYKWIGTLPSVGTRAHYDADGYWWTAPEDGEKFAAGTQTLQNITLYAHWQPEKYNIYYWSNDGLGIWSTSVLFYPVEEVPLPLMPARAGFAFQGWYTEKLDDLRHDLVHNDPVPQDNKWTPRSAVSGDMNLYALWKVVPPGAYTVTFASYDNEVVETKSALFENGYIISETIPAVPSRSHYTCDGKWYMSNGLEFTNSVVLSGNITVRPHWIGNTYTVKFMENNVDETVWETRSVTYPVSTLQGQFPSGIPSRPNYTPASDGWWTEVSGGVRFTESSAITGNIRVYKRWTGNTYTVKYWGVTDASAQAVELTTARTVTYPVDSLTAPGAYLPTAAELPSRKHYHFDGVWRTAGGLLWNAAQAVSGNTDLYADWTANTYTVSFNLMGGSAANSGTQTVNYPAASINMPTAPSKTGNVFAGWIYRHTGGQRYFAGNLNELYERDCLRTGSLSVAIEAEWITNANAGSILNAYDNQAAGTNHQLTHGGAYDDDFVVGSGAYSGPAGSRAFAEELIDKLAQAAALRQGTQQSSVVQTESGSQTVTVTVYDYAAINLIKQQIEDMLASPSFAGVRGTFAATGHTINYTGARQSVTVMNSGIYEIELWGASGGHIWSKNDKTALGGKGGWTKGSVRLNAGDVLKFYVGQEGYGTAVYNGSSFSKITNFSAEGAGASYVGGHRGGWNGGGNGGSSYGGDYAGGSGGGGATDVRYVGTYSVNKNDAGTYSQRIMAAAGGGGAAQSASYNSGWPGLAGGDAGANGIRKGNVQTGGARPGGTSAQASISFGDGSATSGSQIGVGGNGANGGSAAYEGPGGGGGGWYGGESISTLRGTEYTSSGAGGSSHIGTEFESAGRDSGLNQAFGNGKASIRYIGQ
jgi:uncharacterized repeat protein (TIGR02543 family)